MNVSQLFNFVAPFTLMALMGLIITAYGFVNPQQPGNALQFFVGIPLAFFSVLAHFFVRALCKHDATKIWLIEGAIVLVTAYLFLYKW